MSTSSRPASQEEPTSQWNEYHGSIFAKMILQLLHVCIQIRKHRSECRCTQTHSRIFLLHATLPGVDVTGAVVATAGAEVVAAGFVVVVTGLVVVAGGLAVVAAGLAVVTAGLIVVADGLVVVVDGCNVVAAGAVLAAAVPFVWSGTQSTVIQQVHKHVSPKNHYDNIVITTTGAQIIEHSP